MPARARKTSHQQKSIRKQSSTTVRIPQELYEEAKRLAAENESVGELIAESLKEKLRRIRKQRIDESFAGMATDESYQAETLKVSREFQASDWHALEQTEGK
jgi:predicted CopG family antitoxin